MWRTGWVKMAWAVSGAAKFFAGAQARAIALRLALCFVLGVALGGQARAEGAGVIAGSGGKAQGENIDFWADFPFKKCGASYFDILGRTDIQQAYGALWEVERSLFEKYLASRNVSDMACWQDPAGQSGVHLWIGTALYADSSIYKLDVLWRDVAWIALCNMLEPVAMATEAKVRQSREFAANLARQRQGKPPMADSPELSATDLQYLADGYQKLELSFAWAMQKFQRAQAESLQRLSPEIRRILSTSVVFEGDPVGRAAIPAPDLAFLGQARQKRLAIVDRLDSIMYQVGRAYDSSFKMAVRFRGNKGEKDELFLAEACTRAAIAQFVLNSALPEDFRQTVDEVIKSTACYYLDDILNNFNILVNVYDDIPPEINADRKYLYYYKQDVSAFHQARDLVRELKEYVVGHRQLGQ